MSVDPETDTMVSILDRIVIDPTTDQPVVDFTPVPFGSDMLAQFGDEFAVPIVGNFDPPLTTATWTLVGLIDLAVIQNAGSNTLPAGSPDEM